LLFSFWPVSVHFSAPDFLTLPGEAF
jgi:hypothetical protein